MLEGLDGSQWIFEMRDKDGYKMIDVWSPENRHPEDALKRARIDPSALGDFLIYKRVGIEILSIGGVLPIADELY